MYYLARRKLNFTPQEWDALPWHYRRMYEEGLEEEFTEEGASDNGPEVDGIEHDDAFDKAMAGAKVRRAERAT